VPVRTIRRGCAVLTAALAATAVLAACTASRPVPAAGGAGPGGRPGVPGISGPPAIKVNPWRGTVGWYTRPRITLPPIPPADSAAPISLPVEVYAQASVQQYETLSAAAAQLAQRCMSAAGFSYPIVPRSTDDALLTQFFDHQQAGLTSLVQARAYGFQQPPSTARLFAAKRVEPPLPTYAAEQRKHGTAWASALVGEVPGMRPGTPPLGCMRAANTLLFGNLNGSLVGFLENGSDLIASRWTASDPHLLAAQRTWSACMARHGLNYKSMADLVQRDWPNPPTQAEITAAVTEVGCNHQANLANTYLTVEAAYQQALIGLNQPDLQQMQADFVTEQQRAAQVLALPASDILRFSHARVHQVIYLLIPRFHGGHPGV
jgi:hypothetical protein